MSRGTCRTPKPTPCSTQVRLLNLLRVDDLCGTLKDPRTSRTRARSKLDSLLCPSFPLLLTLPSPLLFFLFVQGSLPVTASFTRCTLWNYLGTRFPMVGEAGRVLGRAEVVPIPCLRGRCDSESHVPGVCGTTGSVGVPTKFRWRGSLGRDW